MNQNNAIKLVPRFKNGSEIHIKKSHRGRFTEYCNGNVTNECIARGKKSPNPAIRKLATFAANARKWKHQYGGVMPHYELLDPLTLAAMQDAATQESIKNTLAAQLAELAKRQAKVDKTNAIVDSIGSFAKSMASQVLNMVANKKMANGMTNAQGLLGNFMDLFNGHDDLKSQMMAGKITQEQAYQKILPTLDGGAIENFAFDESGNLKIKGNKYTQAAAQQLYLNEIQKELLRKLLLSNKKGGKLKNKKRLIQKTSRPFGHISILDDTLMVNPKTFKLRSHGTI